MSAVFESRETPLIWSTELILASNPPTAVCSFLFVFYTFAKQDQFVNYTGHVNVFSKFDTCKITLGKDIDSELKKLEKLSSTIIKVKMFPYSKFY